MKDLATLLNLRLGDLILQAEQRLNYRDKPSKDVADSVREKKPGSSIR
jgi:hypothetical protein